MNNLPTHITIKFPTNKMNRHAARNLESSIERLVQHGALSELPRVELHAPDKLTIKTASPEDRNTLLGFYEAIAFARDNAYLFTEE